MQFEHKFVSGQQKFVNNFIHIKLVISNIKIVENYLM